jgi:hypothetical protein
MRYRFTYAIATGAIAVIIAVVVAMAVTMSSGKAQSAGQQGAGQLPTSYHAPRTSDGRPNLNGIWEALSTAYWDLEGHAAGPSAFPEMLGAFGAIPPGLSVVEGNTLPYQPWALARKKENFAKRLAPESFADVHNRNGGDPEARCYLPGVPRATYMPFPFQIVQTPREIFIGYEYAMAGRTIYMDSKEESPIPSWMGWSRGHWEGETLVVDVTDMNENTWFDRAGNFHSDALHVVERYTPVSPYHLQYEATIEDPKVFTRPWKISMPLYRRVEKNAQLVEFKCVEFAEPLMYHSLVKQPTS